MDIMINREGRKMPKHLGNYEKPTCAQSKPHRESGEPAPKPEPKPKSDNKPQPKAKDSAEEKSDSSAKKEGFFSKAKKKLSKKKE